eukprot:CAMPEP_0202871340 /NCGR_PEP_ID=MMETSP1391-20130828/18428_1 /ASSEMBLY_ACC=CAM_ASM_000867 /TAXON_ID=1034604 /ORGANISM="Chlamydomonas leiostraca, Strain SAG 11-49" /LENGTH=310 /DNA_ID=CAMNT_0049552109 /DNA_START=24 /DNA_END=956 /DNA_ORIENTATION=+
MANSAPEIELSVLESFFENDVWYQHRPPSLAGGTRQPNARNEHQARVRALEKQLEGCTAELSQLRRSQEGTSLLVEQLEKLMQVKRALAEENERLKAENKMLWMDAYLRDLKSGDEYDAAASCSREDDTVDGSKLGASTGSSGPTTTSYYCEACSDGGCKACGAVPCPGATPPAACSPAAKSIDAPSTPSARWTGDEGSLPSDITCLHSWRSTTSAPGDLPLLAALAHASDDDMLSAHSAGAAGECEADQGHAGACAYWSAAAHGAACHGAKHTAGAAELEHQFAGLMAKAAAARSGEVEGVRQCAAAGL